MKSCLIFFAILATAAANPVVDYCTRSCLVNGTQVPHLRCGHNGEFSTECKGNPKLMNIGEDEKKFIIKTLNEYRNFVAGGGDKLYEFDPACRMATLQWHGGLAEHATLYEKTCREGLDYCHGTLDYPNSGHLNFARFLTKGSPNVTYNLKYMFRFYHNAFLEAYGSTFGDSTTRIGCAGKYWFTDRQYPSATFSCFHNKNFVQPQPLYAKCEKPATGCKTGPNPEFPNLCSVDEEYE